MWQKIMGSCLKHHDKWSSTQFGGQSQHWSRMMSDCSEPWMSCDLCGASPEQPCQDPDVVEKMLKEQVDYLANYETVGVNGEEPHLIKPNSGGYDSINPNHYNKYPIQPIDFIQANNLGFCEGNVIKYVLRAADKGGVEDIDKAMQYLQFIRDHMATNAD